MYLLNNVKYISRQQKICRWTAQDPLAEQYYSTSPYAFCAGNPVKFVDEYGEKLYFAPGSSDKFKEQFAVTVQYMNSKGTAGDIAKLHASPLIYYIAETNVLLGNVFSPEHSTIYWNPNNILETSDGKWISPATALAHEADHAQEYDKAKRDVTKVKTDILNKAKDPNSDPDYQTLEERRVITGSEQRAARKHGEIDADQVTRTNHFLVKKSIPTNDAKPEKISEIIYERNKYL